MEVDQFRLASQVEGWKTTHGSIWSDLDFPKNYMGTTGTGAVYDPIKGYSWQTQDLDRIFRSDEMFAILASARQKVQQQPPFCTNNRQQAASFVAWDNTIQNGVTGFRGGFNQDSGPKVSFSTYGGGGGFYSLPNATRRDLSHRGTRDILFKQPQTVTFKVGEKYSSPTTRDIPTATRDIPERTPWYEALSLLLPQMVLQDVLVLEQVCKSFKESVSQSFRWRCLRIENPLNGKVTDDILFRLAARSEGELRTLILIDCGKITDAGIENVVAANPKISRICLINSILISGEAIVRVARVLSAGKARGMPGLKRLEIRGTAGISREDYEQLAAVLDVDREGKKLRPRPRFFPSNDGGDRVIDLEVCPRCREPRLLYDCPRGNCPTDCRACANCITRCYDCGVCLNNVEYEETFALQFLCAACQARGPTCIQCGKQQFGLAVSNGTFLCPVCAGPYTGKAAGRDFYVM